MVDMGSRIRERERRSSMMLKWWIWMARTDKTEPNPISICRSETEQTNINGGLKKI